MTHADERARETSSFPRRETGSHCRCALEPRGPRVEHALLPRLHRLLRGRRRFSAAHPDWRGCSRGMQRIMFDADLQVAVTLPHTWRVGMITDGRCDAAILPACRLRECTSLIPICPSRATPTFTGFLHLADFFVRKPPIKAASAVRWWACGPFCTEQERPALRAALPRLASLCSSALLDTTDFDSLAAWTAAVSSK